MDWPIILKGLAVVGTFAVMLLGVPKTKEDAKHVGLYFAAVFVSLLAAVVLMLVMLGS